MTNSQFPKQHLIVSAVLAFGVISGHRSFAQADSIRPQSGSPGIVAGVTTHGHGEVRAKPDVAYATLTVTTESRDQMDATQMNASRASALMAVLKKSGIAEKDIHTSYYSVSPQYDYNANPPVRTGYQVSNAIDVTLRDLSKIGIILDKAAMAGAAATNGPRFDLVDRQKVEGQALVAAVVDARTKADLMAGAAGLQIGRLLSLSDTVNSPEGPVQPLYRMTAMAAATPSTPISPQEITVTADVTEVFALDYGK